MTYLSPAVPRWVPATEGDVRAAAADGLLTESHYLDLKARIPREKNRELARDLASFAIDGGALLVGVGQSHDDEPALAPIELQGEAERVEQIARAIPDPPIPVRCTRIPSDADPERGYLLVEIPATGLAPHMVDGAYMGRGDKTKHTLSDADVLRHHQLRENTSDVAAAMVEEYVQRDPIPSEFRRQAHGFIVAAPLRPRTEMMLEVVEQTGDWRAVLARLLDQGASRPGTVLAQQANYAPDLRSAGIFGRRHDGYAVSYGLSETREPAWRDGGGAIHTEDAVELEVTEDGTVRVMTTRLGDDPGNGRGQEVFVNVLPDLTRRAVSVAALVAELTGYLGPWMLGVAATGIAGQRAFESSRVNVSGDRGFSAQIDEYRATTQAATIELQDTPGAVTKRLVGRYLRSVGHERQREILPLIDDDPRG